MLQDNIMEAENTDAELRMKKIEEINSRKDEIKKQAEQFAAREACKNLEIKI